MISYFIWRLASPSSNTSTARWLNSAVALFPKIRRQRIVTSSRITHREYRFSSLDSTDSIRLLHLNAGSPESSLSGRLETTRLSAKPDYEAVSYVWGDPQKEATSKLEDGSFLRIGKSLHDALSDLRSDPVNTHARIVWADAVCINQEDYDERRRQVSIMGPIYREAKRVITYIGSEADNSSIGIEFAYELRKYGKKNFHPDPRLHMLDESANLGFPLQDDPRWQALRLLITRPWASRCWCSQEFVLNDEVLMMCGRKEIDDWDLIPEIVQLVFNRKLPLYSLPSHSDDPLSLRECLVSLRHFRKSFLIKPEQFQLLSLLRRNHPLQATDPKDKVYSLLALAQDRAQLSINVDYDRPVEQVYTKVAASILNKYQSTHLLYSNLAQKSLRLPSWVPDWSRWKFGSNGTVQNDWYNACGVSQASMIIDSEQSHLHITGSLVDQICHVGENVGLYYGRDENPDRHDWLQKQIGLVESLKPYPDSSASLTVLWRTLIANIDPRTWNTPEDDYEAYFHAHMNLNQSSPDQERDMAQIFRDSVRRRQRYRSLCITKKGYFGAIPQTSEVGDWVCMFEGTKCLFVVRKLGEGFQLVGPAYVHGLMDGEVFELDNYERRVITLV